MTDYQQAVAYIHGRPRIKKEATQRRINELLRRLGHPEQSIQTIHVVGTNGKGSVVAYLQQLLMESGLKVGAFTSPFIVRFNERIQINQVPISDAELVQLVQKVRPVVTELDQEDSELGPSEFELITALMYLYFQKQQVEIALVEAGIGGQSDSTNVSDQALLTIVTTIGMDHMQILGDTVEKIATDKAGMIRKHRPTVTGILPKAAQQVVKTVATRRNSPLFQLEHHFHYRQLTERSFAFTDCWGSIASINTNMIGDFEMEDAAIAIAAFRTLALTQWQWPMDRTVPVIGQAISKTRWAGRMELLQDQPRLLIDGAHNVPAIKRLLKTLTRFPERRINVVLAVLADKQYQEMVQLLAEDPHIHLYLTEFAGAKQRHSADFTTSSFAQFGYIPDWKQAIHMALQQTDNDGLTLVTGSLLFISTVRSWWLHRSEN
ncbi:bifunctional folylpolyglutamate synthase/dihydrofolate synthase [Fructilactobacillus hinvesii]|uniref:tetrahydrofolate synthase n=1 Tax=Fructilactobacillus hinvesii TaxID=2940300 RepID=A0ABY5BRK4_9LACO|nr:folylpolyglutamate synthase/dihydrofolate synthase family protein [Fructilactobacillus hinvesii]USS87687.1 bifunctional folylpolyglutamate synthase/dihydrofolate synthase [Fructilactobacillus hinvesii]